ncbi:hypothetical protein SDC9_152754 [bioreactor metagenome]|uniref:Uncharacterized protein n=1 Tax=bioreactor metagenome TaxID=1076179 RepID=A0A645EYE2_9ZZZZ
MIACGALRLLPNVLQHRLDKRIGGDAFRIDAARERVKCDGVAKERFAEPRHAKEQNVGLFGIRKRGGELLAEQLCIDSAFFLLRRGEDICQKTTERLPRVDSVRSAHRLPVQQTAGAGLVALAEIARVVAERAAHMQLQRVFWQTEGSENLLFFGEDFREPLLALLGGDCALTQLEKQLRPLLVQRLQARRARVGIAEALLARLSFLRTDAGI